MGTLCRCRSEQSITLSSSQSDPRINSFVPMAVSNGISCYRKMRLPSVLPDSFLFACVVQMSYCFNVPGLFSISKVVFHFC